MHAGYKAEAAPSDSGRTIQIIMGYASQDPSPCIRHFFSSCTSTLCSDGTDIDLNCSFGTKRRWRRWPRRSSRRPWRGRTRRWAPTGTGGQLLPVSFRQGQRLRHPYLSKLHTCYQTSSLPSLPWKQRYGNVNYNLKLLASFALAARPRRRRASGATPPRTSRVGSS